MTEQRNERYPINRNDPNFKAMPPGQGAGGVAGS
jgi:hypothetical protein